MRRLPEWPARWTIISLSDTGIAGTFELVADSLARGSLILTVFWGLLYRGRHSRAAAARPVEPRPAAHEPAPVRAEVVHRRDPARPRCAHPRERRGRGLASEDHASHHPSRELHHHVRRRARGAVRGRQRQLPGTRRTHRLGDPRVAGGQTRTLDILLPQPHAPERALAGPVAPSAGTGAAVAPAADPDRRAAADRARRPGDRWGAGHPDPRAVCSGGDRRDIVRHHRRNRAKQDLAARHLPLLDQAAADTSMTNCGNRYPVGLARR